jgi:hypothetical protein
MATSIDPPGNSWPEKAAVPPRRRAYLSVSTLAVPDSVPRAERRASCPGHDNARGGSLIAHQALADSNTKSALISIFSK